MGTEQDISWLKRRNIYLGSTIRKMIEGFAGGSVVNNPPTKQETRV